MNRVKERARRAIRATGKVLSDLARRAITGCFGDDLVAADNFFGFEPIASRGGVVSNDLIDRLREEDGV